MRKQNLLILCLMAGAAYGQTVSVPGDFATISDAVDSFNTTDTADPNIVEITAFGPYDEVFPVIGTGAAGDIAAISGQVTYASTNPLTIRGVGLKPLVLIQEGAGASSDGIHVQGSLEVTFDNIVFAASPTSQPTDDLIFVLSDETVLNMTDCVVTALPSDSATYTSIDDIPADLLNGTRRFDPDLLRSGDNGLRVDDFDRTVPSVATANLTNTVLTQQGSGSTPDGIVAIFGTVNLNEGTIISANNRIGVQVASVSQVNLAGTPSNPVVVALHSADVGEDVAVDGLTNDGIRPFGAGDTLTVDNTIFYRNGGGISVFSPGTLTTFSVTNSLFLENYRIAYDPGPGIASGTATLSNSTFYNNAIAIRDDVTDGAATPIEITDVIIAGTGVGIDMVAPAQYTLTNVAIVTEGPDALTTGIVNETGSTQTDVINSDPGFFSTSYTPFTSTREQPDFLFRVTSPDFETAASDGGALSGYGIFQQQTTANAWSLYQ